MFLVLGYQLKRVLLKLKMIILIIRNLLPLIKQFMQHKLKLYQIYFLEKETKNNYCVDIDQSVKIMKILDQWKKSLI